MLAGKLADAAPDCARAGKGDHRDVGIDAERLARLGAAGQNLQHTLGQARFLEQPRDDEAAGERGARIRLEHDSVAGGERRADRPLDRMSGKLNGEMMPITPRGTRRASDIRPPLLGSTSPCGSVHIAAERYRTLVTICTSKPALAWMPPVSRMIQ